MQRIWLAAVVAAVAAVFLGAHTASAHGAPALAASGAGTEAGAPQAREGQEVYGATASAPTGGDEACEEAGDPQAAHLSVSLLQSGLKLARGEGVPSLYRVAWGVTTGPRPRRWILPDADVAGGLGLLLMLLVPFAFLQVVIAWSAAAWLGQAPASSLLPGRDRAAPGDAAVRNEQRPREAPTVVMWYAMLGSFMLNANFTIILPASNQVMLEAGGSTFLSGLCIGSYALGSLISVPVNIGFARSSYKAGILFMALVAAVGNVAYAVMGSFTGTASIVGLILARTLCGLEGGLMIMLVGALTHLSSGAGTAKALAKVNMAGCLGLILGPALASLAVALFPHCQPEVPPAALMTVLAVGYGTSALLVFPGQAECFRLAGVPGTQDVTRARAHNAAAVPADKLRRAWLFQILCCIVSLVRLFQRVSWEAGALLLLTEDYGLGVGLAGLIIAVPALSSLPFIVFVGAISRLGPGGALRMLSLLELFGMIMMFRVGGPSWTSLLVLLLGSSVFYGANWMTVVPLGPLRARFTVPEHWALNVETSGALSWGAGFLGYFYGPVVSRAVLDRCLSQNLLAVSLMVCWLGCFVAMEIGMHRLLPPQEEVVPPPTASKDAQPEEVKKGDTPREPPKGDCAEEVRKRDGADEVLKGDSAEKWEDCIEKLEDCIIKNDREES